MLCSLKFKKFYWTSSKRVNALAPLHFDFQRSFCLDVGQKSQVNVGNWNIEQVVNWARNVVGEDASKILGARKIDGDVLSRISQEELERCGIEFGPANKLIFARNKLQSSSGQSTQNLDFLSIVDIKSDEKTGLKVFHLKELINPKDPSSNKLFIREFYPRYLEAVRKYENTVVVGNPGIGKSWFQYYYLIRILNADMHGLGPLPPNSYDSTEPPKYVIRQVGLNRMETYDIVARTVTFGPCSYDYLALNSNFSPQNTLYFYEPDLDKINEPLSVNVPTMATVSPDTVRYHEFVKQKAAAKLYMPIWTKDELLATREHVTPVATEAEVKKRYVEFGGIFRYVFGPESVCIEALEKRKNEIATVDLSKLLDATTIEDARVSHLLAQFQNIPTHNSASSLAFRSYTIDIVSDAVLKQLQEKWNTKSLAERIATLKKNDQSPAYYSSLCRELYEDFVMERLLRGVTWQERSNQEKAYSTFKLKLSRSQYFPQFKEMINNVLYRSLKDTFPLIDFVYKQNEKYFGIQVSREKEGKRSIKALTVKNFLALLKENNIKEEDFTYYYCPSPKFADDATIKISHPKNKTDEEEKIEEPESFSRVSWKIIKVPENYGKETSKPPNGNSSVKE